MRGSAFPWRVSLVIGCETIGALNIRLENGGKIQLFLKTPAHFLYIFLQTFLIYLG